MPGRQQQGALVGERGMCDKRFVYEDSLRMPLLVRYPAKVRPGTVNRDIAPNIDFAGVPIPSDMQGRSLRPLLRGATPRD